MYPTDYLYSSFVEISLFLGMIYLVGLFLLFLCVIFKKLTLRRFFGYAGLILLAFALMLGTTWIQYHKALTQEPTRAEAVYVGEEHEGSLIPFTHAFDDTLLYFYEIDDKEDFAVGLLDKRVDLVDGANSLKEGHIYQLSYYDAPVLELLEAVDTGKTVNDADSANDIAVYSQKFEEDGGYEEFDILYYGNDSRLLKTWIEEDRYYKKDGWQKSDFLPVEEIYPGIDQYDYLTAEYIEREDYYMLRFVATGLENASHMKALGEIGYIELGGVDGRISYAQDWIDDLKDQGFTAVPKTKWKALELGSPGQEASEEKSQNASPKETATDAGEEETTGTTRYIKHRFSQK